jgi:long-subunit acyl-CoA synthetase (AMP-forming)
MRNRATPLFVFEHATIPAASVWTGSRLWVEYFRSAGLRAGDRVLLALDPSPAWLMVFVACLWEDLTIVPVPPSSPGSTLGAVRRFDARLAIASMEDSIPAVVRPDRHGRPTQPVVPREAVFATSPETRLILSTSGTCGRPTHAAISDRNLDAVLGSHIPELAITEHDICLSLLPWTHAFGLIIDLMTAIFAGATVVRDPANGRDTSTIPALADRWSVTRACMVPLQAEHFAADEQGRRFLTALRGGIIGGAPVDADLSRVLATTRLCVGYGQTEASPGIALGRPGEWSDRTIGRAIGCETRIDRHAHLHCRGDNVCDAVWREDAGLVPMQAGRWLDTGDLVSPRPDGTMAFVGRADHAFKLSNGRLVNAPELERRLAAALGDHAIVLITTRDHRTIDLTITTRDAQTLDSVGARGDEGLRQAAEPILGSLMRHVGHFTVRAEHEIERDQKGQFLRPQRRDHITPDDQTGREGLSSPFHHAA